MLNALNGLRQAKVTAIHPEAHAVDLVFMDTGARVPLVKVLSASASTNSGVFDLHDPTAPDQPYSVKATNDRDIYAYVAFCGGRPVVLGFSVPEVSQMTFADKNRRIERHASDVYTSLDNDGNFEFYHPSGTFVRIGTATAHEDLTAKDFDKNWKIARNTDKAVHVHMEVANGGAVKATLDIDPTGKITVTSVSDVAATIQGNVNLAVTGNITSNAAQWNHTGDVAVTGKVTASTDVLVGSISLKNHKHGGVTAGAAQTGVPV